MTRVVSQLGGVNLAQGMPNFPPPKALLEAAHRAIDGDFHQYAITWGTPSLRRAIADKYRAFYGMDVDPERHVTVCCGATETMLSTLLAVLNPGDEVIIFEPFYENYGPGCIISGATPVWVPLEPPDFGFDPDRLRRARSRSAFGARTTSSPSARRTRCRRRRSPRCDSPSDITSSYARVTRSGATYSGATSRARASWPGSPAARTTSSPTPRTS